MEVQEDNLRGPRKRYGINYKDGDKGGYDNLRGIG
jgi:hypothetical protein